MAYEKHVALRSSILNVDHNIGITLAMFYSRRISFTIFVEFIFNASSST